MGRKWISILHLLLRQRFAQHEEASKRPVPKTLKITPHRSTLTDVYIPWLLRTWMGLPLLESNRQTHEGLPVDVSIVSL